MNVIIIGYGSIGRRHEEVLLKLDIVSNVDIVTKQKLDSKQTFYSLNEIPNLNVYDYFIIASETNKHYEQLQYLDSNVSNKLIFCEKPLFESKKEIEIKNNKVFVGYVLRFHPLLEKLQSFIKGEHIILSNAQCGQYLPFWRSGSDYRNSYSAKKEDGGGVLLDLSHEIDYIQWICGEINELKSYQVKISDLEINSDDLTMLIGKTNKNILVNVSIDYISKNTHRRLLVETFEHTYELNFILNKLVKKNKAGLEEVHSISNLERNTMFERMHLDIFNKQKTICTFEEALRVMNTISNIQEQNK